MEPAMMLRRLMLSDGTTIRSMLNPPNTAASALDAKTHALVRLASLLAMHAAHPSYLECIGDALAAGASEEDVVGTLIAVAPTVGVARIVSAAPEVALALGYEVDEVWEKAPGFLGARTQEPPVPSGVASTTVEGGGVDSGRAAV